MKWNVNVNFKFKSYLSKYVNKNDNKNEYLIFDKNEFNGFESFCKNFGIKYLLDVGITGEDKDIVWKIESFRKELGDVELKQINKNEFDFNNKFLKIDDKHGDAVIYSYNVKDFNSMIENVLNGNFDFKGKVELFNPDDKEGMKVVKKVIDKLNSVEKDLDINNWEISASLDFREWREWDKENKMLLIDVENYMELDKFSNQYGEDVYIEVLKTHPKVEKSEWKLEKPEKIMVVGNTAFIKCSKTTIKNRKDKIVFSYDEDKPTKTMVLKHFEKVKPYVVKYLYCIDDWKIEKPKKEELKANHMENKESRKKLRKMIVEKNKSYERER